MCAVLIRKTDAHIGAVMEGKVRKLRYFVYARKWLLAMVSKKKASGQLLLLGEMVRVTAVVKNEAHIILKTGLVC